MESDSLRMVRCPVCGGLRVEDRPCRSCGDGQLAEAAAEPGAGSRAPAAGRELLRAGLPLVLACFLLIGALTAYLVFGREGPAKLPAPALQTTGAGSFASPGAALYLANLAGLQAEVQQAGMAIAIHSAQLDVPLGETAESLIEGGMGPEVEAAVAALEAAATEWQARNVPQGDVEELHVRLSLDVERLVRAAAAYLGAVRRGDLGEAFARAEEFEQAQLAFRLASAQVSREAPDG